MPTMDAQGLLPLDQPGSSEAHDQEREVGEQTERPPEAREPREQGERHDRGPRRGGRHGRDRDRGRERMDQAQGMDQQSERNGSEAPLMAPTTGNLDIDAAHPAPASAPTQMQEAPQAPARREVTTHEDATGERQARSNASTASATPPAVTASAEAPAPSMPRAAPFVLPVTDLSQMADQSGLIWVHSDTAKVAEVQSLIAAEPRANHVPRERPAPVQINEGPLVLVETRRDLAEMRLPFEQEAASV